MQRSHFMRVIGGQLRGKKLHCLSGRVIRPTADRLREAVFNMLGDRVVNAEVLDLFAGTGALAIEALSRGARRAVLVDCSRPAVELMRRNLTACRFDESVRVVQWDICRNLNCLAADPQRFDLVFLDPPYQKEMVDRALETLFKSGALRRNARLVVEHAADEAVDPGSGFRIDRQRRYGKTRVSFLTVC